MTDETASAALIEAVFDLLPSLYKSDKDAALENLRTHAYRPARGTGAQPMMARQVNEMVICIVTSPARPLPQINLVGPDASFYLDVLESALRDRNFEVVKSTRDEKREIRTYSATIEGPIMAVTMIRPLATTNTLSLLVVPPLAVKPKARQ